MAWICPRCDRAEGVAYVANGGGLTPFPCLHCDRNAVYPAPPEGRAIGSAPCRTDRCAGMVCDVFEYDVKGRLYRVVRAPCQHCGQTSARAIQHGRRGPKEHLAPRPVR